MKLICLRLLQPDPEHIHPKIMQSLCVSLPTLAPANKIKTKLYCKIDIKTIKSLVIPNEYSLINALTF